MLTALSLLACQESSVGHRPFHVELGPIQTWSDAEPPFDQHHATVAVLPSAGVPPTDAIAAYVTWTDRQLWQNPTCRLRALDRDGAPLGPNLALHDGSFGAKPDIGVDSAGLAVVAYQSVHGVVFDRVNVLGAAEESLILDGGIAVALGNNSVDLAVRSDGSTLLVWFDEQPPLALYHTAAVGADLQQLAVLPDVLAVVADTGASTPDIDVDGQDRPTIAWVDQHEDSDDDLRLDSFEAGGAPRWSVVLDQTTSASAARRANVGTDPAGRMAVAWDRRSLRETTPSTTWLGFLNADGSWLREPFVPVEGDNDGVVLTMVGDDAVWLVWTELVDPVEGVGTIRAALLSFPDGQLLQGPIALSTSDAAYRPHTDSAWWGDGQYGIAVSWEEDDADGVRLVKGLTAVAK